MTNATIFISKFLMSSFILSSNSPFKNYEKLHMEEGYEVILEETGTYSTITFSMTVSHTFY